MELLASQSYNLSHLIIMPHRFLKFDVKQCALQSVINSWTSHNSIPYKRYNGLERNASVSVYVSINIHPSGPSVIRNSYSRLCDAATVCSLSTELSLVHINMQFYYYRHMCRVSSIAAVHVVATRLKTIFSTRQHFYRNSRQSFGLVTIAFWWS